MRDARHYGMRKAVSALIHSTVCAQQHASQGSLSYLAGTKFGTKPLERLLGVVTALLHRAYKLPYSNAAQTPPSLKKELAGRIRSVYEASSCLGLSLTMYLGSIKACDVALPPVCCHCCFLPEHWSVCYPLEPDVSSLTVLLSNQLMSAGIHGTCQCKSISSSRPFARPKIQSVCFWHSCPQA